VSHWRNKLQKVVNSGFLRPATSNFPDPTVSRPRAYSAEPPYYLSDFAGPAIVIMSRFKSQHRSNSELSRICTCKTKARRRWSPGSTVPVGQPLLQRNLDLIIADQPCLLDSNPLLQFRRREFRIH
jgi:hypothetical protein